jgi:tetratricopeptide (TPR) repeat protein
MASFKDPKRRMAILIADLYYESEQHQKALSIYQRLENRELGTLSKNELAYVTLGIFNCYCWNHNKDEIQYIETKVPLFTDTPSESRAILGYANRIIKRGTFEAYISSAKAYILCMKRCSTSRSSENVYLFSLIRLQMLIQYAKDNNLPDMAKIFSEEAEKVGKDFLSKKDMNPSYVEPIKILLQEIIQLAKQ